MAGFTRGEVDGSDMYAHKKYKFNKKILDIIQREKGEQLNLLNHQIEQVLQKVYNGEYTSLIKKLTDVDKEKLIVSMKDASPTTALYQTDDDEKIDKKFTSISNFWKENFTQEEVDEYIEFCLSEFYKPSELYNGTTYYNVDIINFLDKMNVEMVMGFIIIKDYMNHAMNVLDGVDDKNNEYTEETLMSNESLDEKYDSLRKYIKETEFLISYENNDTIVVATDNLNAFDGLKTKIDLKDELIPKDYFNWGNDDRNGDETMRERLNDEVKAKKDAKKPKMVNAEDSDRLSDFAKQLIGLSSEERHEKLKELSPDDFEMLTAAMDDGTIGKSFEQFGKDLFRSLIGLSEAEQRKEIERVLMPNGQGVLTDDEKEKSIDDVLDEFNSLSESDFNELTEGMVTKAIEAPKSNRIQQLKDMMEKNKGDDEDDIKYMEHIRNAADTKKDKSGEVDGEIYRNVLVELLNPTDGSFNIGDIVKMYDLLGVGFDTQTTGLENHEITHRIKLMIRALAPDTENVVLESVTIMILMNLNKKETLYNLGMESVSKGNRIPPNTPCSIIHENKKPSDVLLHGCSYFGSSFRIMDDYSSVDILHNGIIYNDYFETIGGFTATNLAKDSDIDEFISNTGEAIEDLDAVDLSIIKDFVGTIEMYVEVTTYDANDNPTKQFIDPNELGDEDIYYDSYIENKYGEETDVSVFVNINGTFSKITPLTSAIYNNL